MKRAFLLLTILLLSVGCATQKDLSTDENVATAPSITKDELEEILKVAEAAWLRRYEKDQLLIAINHFEKAFKSNLELPEKYNKIELATYLARGYYQLGDYHETEQKIKIQAYKSGGEWAQKGLMLNQYFASAIGDRGHFEPGLKFVEKNQVGCLYWYLANIGKWALNSGVNTSIKYNALVKNIANRIVELDPNYFYGGIYRILGAYYAVIPAYAGGDLNKSWDYFQKSLSLGPQYLGTKILLAQAFAVYRHDEILFRKIINEVIRTKLDQKSDIYPENYLEQKKASFLLSNVEEYFD